MIALRHTLLPEPVAPATSTCGILVEVGHERLPDHVDPERDLERGVAGLRTGAEESTSAEIHRPARPVRDLDADRALAGIGARMRMRWARSARARSSSRETIWFTLTPAAGSNSNVVTTGPGWISVTRPSMPKSASLRDQQLRFGIEVGARSSDLPAGPSMEQGQRRERLGGDRADRGAEHRVPVRAAAGAGRGLGFAAGRRSGMLGRLS